MITWYNTLISIVLALAVGFVACLVLVPREIVIEPVMHFSPEIQVGPESLWERPVPTPEAEEYKEIAEGHDGPPISTGFIDLLWEIVEGVLTR